MKVEVFLSVFVDDLIGEDAMIDLYHEMLKRIENSINDIAQYASVCNILSHVTKLYTTT